MTKQIPEANVLKSELLVPSTWETKAKDLFQAASGLERLARAYWDIPSTLRASHQPYLSAHLMLAGFAMENVLKAIIVVKKRDVLEQEYDKKQRLPRFSRRTISYVCLKKPDSIPMEQKQSIFSNV